MSINVKNRRVYVAALTTIVSAPTLLTMAGREIMWMNKVRYLDFVKSVEL